MFFLLFLLYILRLLHLSPLSSTSSSTSAFSSSDFSSSPPPSFPPLHPAPPLDLLACRPCGLLFAHAWGLKDHQIRGCPIDEPPTKRCKREDDGVEGTYGYELECYLKDLPATVCCADELPAQTAAVATAVHIHDCLYVCIGDGWPRTFIVNTDTCDRDGSHWVAFHFPLVGSARRIVRFAGKRTGNVSPPFRQRPDRQRTAILLLFVSNPTRRHRFLRTVLPVLP